MVKYHPCFVEVSHHCHLYCITMLIMKDGGEGMFFSEPKMPKYDPKCNKSEKFQHSLQ